MNGAEILVSVAMSEDRPPLDAHLRDGRWTMIVSVSPKTPCPRDDENSVVLSQTWSWDATVLSGEFTLTKIG